MLLLCVADALRVAPLRHGMPRRFAQPRFLRAGRPVAGWGPDPVWTPNTVASNEDAADELKKITIMPPDGVAEEFTVPGQYVQIREKGAEKASFFAIASAPGADGAFEFLIKEQPPSDWSPGNKWLIDAEAGTELEMSQVMGSGFKFAESLEAVDSVLLFAAGSGISPIRSVIESGQLKGKKVQLFYGAQTPEKMAYQDKFAEWEKSGCTVTPVISQPGDSDWGGVTGYVQDAAKAAGVPESSLMLMCGMKGMAEGVKALASEAGVDESKVLANF